MPVARMSTVAGTLSSLSLFLEYAQNCSQFGELKRDVRGPVPGLSEDCR